MAASVKSLQARFGKSLQISTQKQTPQDSGARGWREHRRNSAPGTLTGTAGKDSRRICFVEDFPANYELGKEVMPSLHTYMAVHFATRRRDRHECVVKVRFKPQCFKSKEEEANWRYNTEFLLNMPRHEDCGVAQIFEVLEDAKAFYIIMEKVAGMDLLELLEQETVTVDMARDILRQLLQSLAHLHAHNAVHKDLKLENVMLDLSPKSSKSFSSGSSPKSAVKVIDFDTLEEWTPHSAKAKDVLGTDQYIAQEAYAGKYSPLSDIFSTGVIAYRLLSGKFPFQREIFDDEAGENWVGSPKMGQIRQRLKVAKIDFTHRVFCENPQAIDLIMKMLAYNEKNRPTAEQALLHPWFQGSAGPQQQRQKQMQQQCPRKQQALLVEPSKEGTFAPADGESIWSRQTTAASAASTEDFDDSTDVAEEAVVGDERRALLLRA